MENVKRLAPKAGVLRALFAKSGNQCAFPGCTSEMINHKNDFVGQVCHIEAALTKGERFNTNQTNDERRNFNNLILLCYAHHIETNDVEAFSVEKLNSIKLQHESENTKNMFKVDEALLYQIEQEISNYWADFDRIKTIHHHDIDLSLDIDSSSSPLEIATRIYQHLDWGENMFSILYDTNRRYHSFVNATMAEKKGCELENEEELIEEENWELHNIALPNFLRRLRGNVMYLELKYLEEYLKTSPNDLVSNSRYESLKELHLSYVSSTYLMG